MPLPFCDLVYDKFFCQALLFYSLRLPAVSDSHFFPAAALIHGVEPAGGAHHRQVCLYVPVFPGDKPLNLIVSVHYQFHGHRLHPACGKTSLDLFPQKRGELIPHEPVQDPSGLLSVDKVHIELPLVGHSLVYTLFGYLVKCYPGPALRVQLQGVSKVPGYCLPLSVRIGGKVDRVAFRRHFFQLLYKLGLAGYGYVHGFEIVFHVYGELLLGQIPDMPHGGHHIVAGSQVFFYCLGLCWALDNHKI